MSAKDETAVLDGLRLNLPARLDDVAADHQRDRRIDSRWTICAIGRCDLERRANLVVAAAGRPLACAARKQSVQQASGSRSLCFGGPGYNYNAPFNAFGRGFALKPLPLLLSGNKSNGVKCADFFLNRTLGSLVDVDTHKSKRWRWGLSQCGVESQAGYTPARPRS